MKKRKLQSQQFIVFFSRTPAESKRKMEEKQRSATLRRQKMVQDNTERIHILTEKVMDVKKLKENLIVERRVLLQELHNVRQNFFNFYCCK